MSFKINFLFKVLFSAVLIFIFTGCKSIDYYSDQKPPETKQSRLKAKFRITEIEASSINHYLVASGPEIKNVCKLLSDSDALQEVAEKNFPQFFSSKKDSLPVTVRIDIDYGRTSLRTFIGSFFTAFSLDMIPQTVDSDHNMSVSLRANKKYISLAKDSKGKLLVERKGYEHRFSPANFGKISEKGNKFFRDKVVEQIVSQLIMTDAAEMNKAYIMRMNRFMMLTD